MTQMTQKQWMMAIAIFIIIITIAMASQGN